MAIGASLENKDETIRLYGIAVPCCCFHAPISQLVLLPIGSMLEKESRLGPAASLMLQVSSILVWPQHESLLVPLNLYSACQIKIIQLAYAKKLALFLYQCELGLVRLRGGDVEGLKEMIEVYKHTSSTYIFSYWL